MSSPLLAADSMDKAQPGLHWAVKVSFRDYVSRLPDGRMSATNGVAQAAADGFLWQVAAAGSSPAPRGADRRLEFAGDLRYAGHGGLLFVRLADPHITLDGDVGSLSVIDASHETEGARITLVTFEISQRDHGSAAEIMCADEVRLTEQGAEVFNMVYPTGEPFEPLMIVWPLQGLDQLADR